MANGDSARIQTIETLLEATARIALRNEEAIKKLMEGHERIQGEISSLIDLHRSADSRMQRVEAALERYIDASNERMKQMEANLDALIRIITAEHSNGKGKLG